MPFVVKKLTQVDTSSPDAVGRSLVNLAKYTEDEFGEVASAMQGTEPDHIWNTVPPKPRRGTYAYADGTHWNPGYGEGPYAFNGSVWTPLFPIPAASVVRPTIQKFTSGSGTYTTPAGVTYLRVRMVAGGGGGAGSGSTNSVAGTGGTTSFGAHSASPGIGGNGLIGGQMGTGIIGAGGIGVIIPGSGGGSSGQEMTSNQVAAGGTGGGSILGGGAQSPGYAQPGITPPQSGGGGSGAGAPNLTNCQAGAGGGGGGGLDIIIPTPVATYAYTVGAGGTAGPAGTSGLAGGAGAAGEIVVEEHYGA
jgi:hypothetical protein